ncbi:ATP-binding protein [Celeribacter sp.]|uniref:ATP-binding protein n=1 Tax=Celeribacter sp. TaxID=1890673 RepID=UPI003A916626
MRLEIDDIHAKPAEHAMLCVAMNASNTSVRKALQSLKTALSERGFLPEEITSIELVLAETLNNIVEHAYCDLGEGPINVKISEEPNGLIFQVMDRGRPMPNGQPPLGILAAIDDNIAELPEGGFGWFLIRELAHDLVYEHDGTSNVFSFRMNIATENGAHL